jgi:serine/threonine protein kinase
MLGAIQVGDRVGGRYEVAEIHQGGMGLVYVALERPEAGKPRTRVLKTLRDEYLRDPARNGRFAAECHLWVHLGRHPNLVRAFAFEFFDGRPFVVLEYVEGGELGRWIGTPALDVPRALSFGLQFCLGMEQAQRAGLVCHRDIKPANLLIDRDGTLKIADFGLVRLREEILAAGLGPQRPIPLDDGPGDPQPIRWTDPPDQKAIPMPVDDEETAALPDPMATIDFAPAAPAVPRTETGWYLGTLSYMAPEQFQDAARADVRADMYAFGVVLFEMLTGQRPFQGQTLAMLRRQHERSAPASVVPAIPRRYRKAAPQIDEVVQRCLRKAPDDRYPSIRAMRDALTGVLRRVGPPSARRFL